MEQEERRLYGPVGSSRLLDIAVVLDGEKIYEGMVEDAPEEIKQLKYSKIEMGHPIIHYVYSDMQ